MIESKFKVGDKVRHTEKKYLQGIIVGFLHGGLVRVKHLEKKIFTIWRIENCESLTPADPKQDFLERLQSLLRDFNAEIRYREGDCELHIDLVSGGKISRMSYPLVYPPFRDRGYLSLTADNIMYYE